MSTDTIQAVSGSVSQKQAIENAKAAFAKLPSGDSVFQQCINDQETVHEVLAALHKQYRVHKRKKFTRLLEAFHRYTSWMNSISGSINLAVQTSSSISCPLWAPIKFVLKVSEDHLEAAEQTLAVIEMISDNLSRLDVYEKLYDDPRFQIALVNVFTDVVEFAVRAYQYFCQRSSRRLVHLVKLRSHDEFGDIVTRIRARTKAVDELASALSQIQAAEFFKETQARAQQERRMHCLQWLRPSNIRESHNDNLASRVGTTCEWVLTNPIFKKWLKPDLSETNTGAMVIYGPAGCGKSVLGSFIFDTLEWREPTSRAITAMFSFSASDVNRRTLSSMVRSLLSQLLEQDIDGKLLPLFENFVIRAPSSTSEILNAFREAIQLLSCPIRTVIDGLDECDDSGRGVYSSLLQISNERSNFHVIFLGQPQAFTASSELRPNIPTICITSIINYEDIRTFVDFQITKSISLSTSSVRDIVSSSLLAKADGMFLWVKLMLDDLERAATDSEVTNRLQDLPRGLEEAYRHILQRLVARSDKYQQKLVRLIFVLVTTCGHPLEYEELQYAYAMMIKPESELARSSIDPFLLRLQPEKIIDLCGGLLTFHGGVFDVVHGSVRDFLGRPTELWSDIESQSIRVFRVSSGDSHGAIGDACMRYLAEVDCGQLQWDQVPSFEHLKSQPPLLQYACSFVAYHLNRSELSADQQMGKVQRLLASNEFFFVAEYLLMISISDSSLEPQIELAILIQTLSSAEAGLGRLLDVVLARGEQEHSARLSKFGDTDPRTKRWINTRDTVSSLLSLVNGSIVSETSYDPNPEQSNNGGISDTEAPIGTSQQGSVEPKSSKEEAVQRQSVKRGHGRDLFKTKRSPIDRAGLGLGHLLELLHTSHDISLGYQFELFVGLIGHVANVRKVLDPLKILWQYVKRRATSMPVLLLAAAAWYYWGLDKNEQALELCNICLGRLTKRDTMLKVFLNHLAGYIHNGLQEYDKAIQHFETVLPVEEQLLGSKQYFLLFAQFVLAKCYTRTEKFAEALQLLDKLLRNRFQSSQSSDILNSPRSEMPQGVAIPHQNSFVMGQLRKRIEQIHDSRSALSSYNINVMTLEIDTYNWHGYVLQHLGRLQEALRSFQRSLELGCKIVEGLKSDDLRVENARIQMLDACDWKARLHHEERRYEDAAKAALEYQDIYQKVRSSKIDVYEDAMHKILCGYIFGENPGKFGFSVQFAKDAMKASVIAACQAFGSTECTEELDCWYNEAEDMLDINNLPSSEDKSDPFNREIEAYKRFLDLYVDLHKQEPLRSLHSDYPSFSRYYQLGVLCYRAEQILNAVEAMKRCIQICEELWSPMPEQMLFSYYVLSWIELSSYYGRLGHVSKSAKSIRRALDLTEEFPGNLENFAYSMDRMVEMVEIADQRLKDARQKRRKARHKCRTLHRLRALQSFWLDSSKVAANGSESKKGHSQGEEPRIREEGRGTRYGTLSVSKGSGPWWRTRKLHGIHVKIALRRSLAKQKPKTVDRADSSKYTHEGAG